MQPMELVPGTIVGYREPFDFGITWPPFKFTEAKNVFHICTHYIEEVSRGITWLRSCDL